MHRFDGRPLLLAVPVLAAAAPAVAQDTSPAPPAAPPESELAREVEVLVTATRRSEPAFVVPWSTDVVGAEEIRDVRMRRTLPDALGDLPGVMVQRTSYGQASPFLRGFTGYHTVMMVDGIRLNNSTFRSGPNQYWGTVDSYSTDRLEVVRGAASVLYGSDAVGGAVNSISRGRTSFEPGSHWDAGVLTRFASAEGSRTYRVESSGNQDDLGVAAGFTYKGYDDLSAGDGTGHQDDTGYRERDGDLRLDFRANEDTVWTFGFQRTVEDDVPRTHRTIHAESFHGTTLGDELRRDLTQERTLLYLRLAQRLRAAFADSAEFTVSYQDQNEMQHRDRTGDRTDLQGYDVETWGAQVQFEKATRIGELTYGVEFWHDDVSSYRHNYVNGTLDLVAIQGPVGDDADYDLLGIYAQDEFDWGATTLTAGARFTYAAADANRVDNPAVSGSDPATPGNIISLDDSWTNVVGSLRAVHPLSPEWNLFGGVSQAFRAPNLSDLTRLDDTSGVEVPSLGLDPEKYLQYETGVRSEQECWSGSLSVFYTQIRDQIVPSPTGGTIGSTPEVRKDNIGDGYIAGSEIEATGRLGEHWTLSGAGTWQHGNVDQFETDGTKTSAPASRLMPLTGVVTATYRDTPSAPWRAWVSAKAASKQDRLSLKDETDTERIPPGGTPGWFTWSIGAVWEISPNATLSAAIENVGDVDYRIHGSGVNEPGRNFVVALDLRF